MNPGRVVIYELDEGMDTDKLIGLIKSKMKPYLLPEFKLGRDFFEDCFLGLSIVCEVGIKQSLRERLDFKTTRGISTIPLISQIINNTSLRYNFTYL